MSGTSIIAKFSMPLKLYSLNFAIAHAQKRLLGLSEFVILVLH